MVANQGTHPFVRDGVSVKRGGHSVSGASEALSRHEVCRSDAAQGSVEFASLCRQLRRSHSLTLKDQAAAFGVSIAYISAIETGRKGHVPDGFLQKFVSWLELDELTAERARRAADESGNKVVIRSKNPTQARFLAALGRSLDDLSKEDIETLRQTVLKLRIKKRNEEGDAGTK